MNSGDLKETQLRHDLRSLIEPLEIVAKLMRSGKIDEAVRIQEAAIDVLRKTVKAMETASSKRSNDGIDA